MKLFKKVLSVAAVMALVVTAIPAKAKAASDVIDFEDGNIPASVFMKVDDGGDVSQLSVVDYNGSKQLLVDVQDATLVPKLQIEAIQLVGASNLDKVRGISIDVTVVNPTGEAAGWNGGGSGAATGADGKTWYNEPNQWVAEEYEKAEAATFTWSMKFVEGLGFTKDAAAGNFLFMKWAGSNDMYLDNIKLLDADGNPLALELGAADAAVTDAAATDAAATDTAATDVPKTGVVDLGIVYGLAAVATGAFALRRKQK